MKILLYALTIKEDISVIVFVLGFFLEYGYKYGDCPNPGPIINIWWNEFGLKSNIDIERILLTVTNILEENWVHLQFQCTYLLKLSFELDYIILNELHYSNHTYSCITRYVFGY